jgi:Leucine-rich repeat (LRR) protein
MQPLNNQKPPSFERFTKDKWVGFLEESAYRGLEINRVARTFDPSKSRWVYSKEYHTFQLINQNCPNIILNMDQIKEKNTSWTFSLIIHKFRMYFDTQYKREFKEKISNLAQAILDISPEEKFLKEIDKLNQDNPNWRAIDSFYYKNLRKLNESSGNEEIQKKLISLSRNLLKKMPSGMNSPLSELAFEIQSTAKAMVPVRNVPWFSINDIIKNIFYFVFKSEGESAFRLNRVSKGFREMVPELGNQWINESGVRLNKRRFKTSKEAVQYIVDHKLTTANLSNFLLSSVDFNKLGENCPQLKILSIGLAHSGSFEQALRKHPNLLSLSINNSKISSARLVKMIEKCSHLESLAFGSKIRFSGNQFVKLAENHPNLQSLTIRVSLPFSNAQFQEAIEKLTNLKYLKIICGRIFSGVELQEAFRKLTKLERLNLNNCEFSGKKLIRIITNLPTLYK